MLKNIITSFKNSIHSALHRVGTQPDAGHVTPAPQEPDTTPAPEAQDIDPTDLTGEAYLHHFMTQRGALALHRQAVFSEGVAGKSWQADIANGYLVFDGNLVLPFQLLGGLNTEQECWLWSWAAMAGQEEGLNGVLAGVHPALTAQSKQMRVTGMQRDVPLLTTGSFAASVDDVHRIGLLANGLFDNSGYYVVESGENLLCLGLAHDALYGQRERNAQFDADVFTRFLQWYEVTALEALPPYLQGLDYTLQLNGNTLTASNAHGIIQAVFDGNGSLTDINAEVSPPIPETH